MWICLCMYDVALPVPWFHPGPCRNTELHSSRQTNAAANSSWCSVVSSTIQPSELSPDPEESRAGTPVTAPQEPCSWTVLHRHTCTNKVSLQRKDSLRNQEVIVTHATFEGFSVVVVLFWIQKLIMSEILNYYSLKSSPGTDKLTCLTMHPDFLLGKSTKAMASILQKKTSCSKMKPICFRFTFILGLWYQESAHFCSAAVLKRDSALDQVALTATDWILA